MEITFVIWIVLVILLFLTELLFSGQSYRKSARKRWPANIALLIMAIGLSALLPFSVFVAANFSASQGYGLLNLINLPDLSHFILSLILLSFWQYVEHYASHKIPILWRFHKIHHSDKALDITTTYRVHPVIYLLSVTGFCGIVILIGAMPIAVIFFLVVVLVCELIQHSTLKFSRRLDQALCPYVITPNLHHIHHSDDVSETDCNFGNQVAFWDRLFGTYLSKPKRSEAEFKLGLTYIPADVAENLDALLLMPVTSQASPPQ